LLINGLQVRVLPGSPFVARCTCRNIQLHVTSDFLTKRLLRRRVDNEVGADALGLRLAVS
ncbi:MAG: hypothetical protein ACYDHE_21685, partial [Candidatus Acidiferrales bacterium]